MVYMIILFAVCTIVYVVMNTARSIVTINGGKMAAAIANAVTYGFYTYIVVLTANEGVSIFWKIAITAASNFAGVYIVKLIEEKKRPERLWKVELAIPVSENNATVELLLNHHEISFNWLRAGDWIVYSCYCYTKEQTQAVNNICLERKGKISAYQAERI